MEKAEEENSTHIKSEREIERERVRERETETERDREIERESTWISGVRSSRSRMLRSSSVWRRRKKKTPHT